MAAPLTSLLQKKKAWEWGKAQQEAFDSLKKALVSTSVLAYPDPQPFIIATDTSDLAVGAVLQQQHPDGLHPVAFFSRKLKGPEVNWSTQERGAFLSAGSQDLALFY